MKFALVSILSLFSAATFAQEEKVVIVRQQNYHKKKKNVERNVENYNAFKFDPFRMGIGEINFSWETRVHDKTTLEFELGPTISNLGANRFASSGPTAPDVFRVNSGMGALVSAAVRYYPLEDYFAMNKLYVSPRFKYRRYNETASATDPSLPDVKGYSNELIFSFNIGFQHWLSDNFAFDYYIGAGIAGLTGKSHIPISTYDGNTNTWTYSWQENNQMYSRFVGVIGMKVAIGN